jgi:predicted secreted Zn-dependent protease
MMESGWKVGGRCFVLATLFAFWLVPVFAIADGDTVAPLFFRSIEHFEIRANSVQELRAEFDGKFNGAMAHTFGRVRYRFETERRDGMCRVTTFRAQCDAKIRLPRWYDVDKAPKELQDWWKKAYEGLREHEFVHADICLQVARDTEWAARKIQPKQFCGSLSEEVERAADSVIASMDRRQREYDRITDHGRKQERYSATR